MERTRKRSPGQNITLATPRSGSTVPTVNLKKFCPLERDQTPDIIALGTDRKHQEEIRETWRVDDFRNSAYNTNLTGADKGRDIKNEGGQPLLMV